MAMVEGIPKWLLLSYRPLWILLNLALILVTFFVWSNDQTFRIKVDLPNIKTQTAKVVKNDVAAQELATNFGFKTRGAVGDDFCVWAAKPEVKAKLKAPFDTLDCSDGSSISLKNFQAYDMHEYADAANTTVWYVYAYGEPGADGELFLDNTNLKVPAATILDPYLGKNGIYSGPDQCASTYLKYLADLNIGLGITIILYLVAHIAHWVCSLREAPPNIMFMVDYVVFGMSVITYIFAIIVFFIYTDSKIFTECAWMSQWFQKDMLMLYQIRLTYIITGSIGLFFCIVHIIAVKTGNTMPENIFYNMVVGDNIVP